MSPKVWVVTGCSGGFGQAIAMEILRQGDKVIATSRSTNQMGELKAAGADVLSLDVRAPLGEIKKIANAAHLLYDRIDILINNAGFTRQGTLEELTPGETIEQFDTNVFGLLNVTRAFLPIFRKQHAGIIANMSSTGAWLGAPAMGIYAASKWAVSGLTESLALELVDFGIQVCAIEPGYFRSNFLKEGNRLITKSVISDYDGTTSAKWAKTFEAYDRKQPGDLVKGAKVIVDVLGGKVGRKIPLRLVLGTDANKMVKEKCESTLKLLEEWKDITTSTDHSDGTED